MERALQGEAHRLQKVSKCVFVCANLHRQPQHEKPIYFDSLTSMQVCPTQNYFILFCSFHAKPKSFLLDLFSFLVYATCIWDRTAFYLCRMRSNIIGFNLSYVIQTGCQMFRAMLYLAPFIVVCLLKAFELQNNFNNQLYIIIFFHTETEKNCSISIKVERGKFICWSKKKKNRTIHYIYSYIFELPIVFIYYSKSIIKIIKIYYVYYSIGMKNIFIKITFIPHIMRKMNRYY